MYLFFSRRSSPDITLEEKYSYDKTLGPPAEFIDPTKEIIRVSGTTNSTGSNHSGKYNFTLPFLLLQIVFTYK